VLTDDARYAALIARDSRFDGVFFVGVQTTGIYCRPICPARTPARPRCEFFGSPALAERAGFRACFRCRPELAPGGAPTEAVDTLVANVAQKIDEGALNERSLAELATELGVSERHLRRATEAKLGVSPVELAQSRRLALAKQLVQDTPLPLTEVAFAAGFGSVRRFNAVFSARMGRSPSSLRAGATARASLAIDAPELIALRLDYRPPYDWDHVLGFLRGRAIPGVEIVGDDEYRRVVHIDGHVGTIRVRQHGSSGRSVNRRGGNVRGAEPSMVLLAATGAERSALQVAVSPSLLTVLMPVVARVRRLFDLDAQPAAIAARFSRDKLLAPLVAKRPGLRVPGAIDPFEASVRALLGQQVSVAAATTLAGRFAAAFGSPHAGGDGLTTRFPTVTEVVAAGPERIGKLGLPRTRAAAIHNFAAMLARGELALDAACDLDAFVAQLVELPGIGPWTAHYLAMRALHVPDAFPAADLGVQKALRRSGPRAAEARAEAWRPYRAYAVMHLWFSLAD
jgi:AraC family transcriptional regulator of adaptative response / DNA-3-methyladenine glycosylase II